jgi:hypothetical protein
LTIGAWSMNWLYHLALIGLSPANTTGGIRARVAVDRSVVIWVTPGPQVTDAMPVLPVAL